MVRSTGNTYNVSKEQNASGIGRRRFRPYPEYKDSGVEWLDQIPSHWNVKRLKFIASINDEVLAETTDPQYEMTYVDIGGVDQYQGIVNREKYVFETAPSRARRKVREGDVIISTVRTYLRAIAQIEAPESNLTVSTGFAVIRTGLIFSSRYAAYALRASYFIEKIVANSVGVSYPAIDASKMSGFSASFPELMEQEAIAAFLDRETAKIDALIEKKERLIELLQEKRTALITQAVTKGLDPTVPMKDSGVEWLGKIPAHWGLKRLKRIVEFRGGGTPSKDNLDYWHGDILWVSPKDMKMSVVIDTEDKITPQAVRESATKLVPAGAVLLVVRSGILMHSIPVALSGRKLTLNQDLKALIPRSDLLPEYLFYLISGMQRKLLAEWKKEGATVESLEIDLVAQTPIPLPEECEQRSIAAFLDRESAKIDALMSKIREAITSLREYRTALISAAVTGKIDVREG